MGQPHSRLAEVARWFSIAGFSGAILFMVNLGAVAAPETTLSSGDLSPDVRYFGATSGVTLDDLIRERRSYSAAEIDPGVDPEGDCMGWAAFTNDGARVLLGNKETSNVTVYDWANMAPLAQIDVGSWPGQIGITDDYAVIPCGFSDEVYIVDLTDYSIDAVIPTGEQPWVTRISPDQQFAYVSCDIDDVCEVIDLTSLTHVNTITGFPIWLSVFSFASENGRSSFQFSEFEVSADGAYILVGDGVSAVHYFNVSTGAIDYSVPIANAGTLGLSGDGTVAVVLDHQSNPGIAYQLDVATQNVTRSVTLPTTISTRDIGVNADGSKAYVGISGNQSAIVRFATSDYVSFSDTYTAFWIGVTPDRSHAVNGQFRFSMVSFETDTIVDSYWGYTQSFGAVSPTTGALVGYDPLRLEKLHAFDVTTPSDIVYRGTMEAGESPEGDCPRRAAITPDGAKAVVTNVLSGNASIINLTDNTVEAVLDVGLRAQDVAITSDSRWAVACGLDDNRVAVLDLLTNTVAAFVPTGTRPGVLVITPDDQYAYVGNIQSNTVSVVELDGPASAEIAQFAVGTIGVTFAGYGVSSGLAMSPTGAYVLVAVSFDDNVKVVETATNSIVATLPVGDFPLSLAFNADGTRALVTNYFSDNVTLLNINGAASSVVATTPVGDGPLRVAYDSVNDRFGVAVLTSKRVVHISPANGANLGFESYSAYGSVYQVLYDQFGGSIVLTGPGGGEQGHLHGSTTGDVVPLPVGPSVFDYSSAIGLSVVTMPGPDVVSLIGFDVIETPEISRVPLDRPGLMGAPLPNPACNVSRVRFVLSQVSQVDLELVDVRGRRAATVASGRFAAGEHEVDMTLDRLAEGVYFAVLRVNGRRADSRKLVVEGVR